MGATFDIFSGLIRQGCPAKNIIEEARMSSVKVSVGCVEGSMSSASKRRGSSDPSGSTGPGKFEMSSEVFSKSVVVLLVN